MLFDILNIPAVFCQSLALIDMSKALLMILRLFYVPVMITVPVYPPVVILKLVFWLQFHPGTAREAVEWLIERIESKNKYGGAELLVRCEPQKQGQVGHPQKAGGVARGLGTSIAGKLAVSKGGRGIVDEGSRFCTQRTYAVTPVYLVYQRVSFSNEWI